MGRFILFILFGTLLSALFVMNPGEEAFGEFLSTKVSEIGGDLGEDAGGGALGFLTERLGRAAGETAGAAAGARASRLFERSNYLIASTYTLDLNGRREGGEWQFLGIAGQFVPTKKPDDLPRLIQQSVLGRGY